MSILLKDINEIWTRLFDHTAFLSGEINFILKEFEQKRSDKEVEYLFLLLEKISDVKDNELGRLKKHADLNLSSVNNNLFIALNTCKRIEDIEEKYKENVSLALAREERKLRWEKFVDSITYKCDRVDNTFHEKEEDLQEFYSDLERKLQITK